MSKKEDSGSWYDKQLEDHVKKLFWALWGRQLLRRFDPEKFRNYRAWLTTIHENRLRGLYVPSDPAGFVPPKEAIGEESLRP